MPASRPLMLSRWAFSSGWPTGVSGFMVRPSSSVYSLEESACTSCGTVWMRSMGLSRRPICSTSDT